MVEVDLRSLHGRESAEVFVVRIVLQEGDTVIPDPAEDGVCDGGLSGA